MQGSIPALSISLDSGYSLDTIHNDKEAKIRTQVSVSGTEDGAYNMSSAPHRKTLHGALEKGVSLLLRASQYTPGAKFSSAGRADSLRLLGGRKRHSVG